MSSRPTSYDIFGYDKDSDVYELLAYIHTNLETAISVANHLATLSLRRKDNNEPFDWIEVGEEYSGIRHYVRPCV